MCSWMFSGGTGVPMMLTSGIFMLATWALVIFVAIYLVRKFVPTRQPHALGILQKRFASEKIDANEYRQHRKDLDE